MTGAARGIGRAVGLRLAQEGATVHAVDVRDLGESQIAIASAGGRCTTGEVDVTDPEQCAGAVAAVLDAHGRIDVLANIAGVGHLGRIEDLTPEEWRRVLAVDLDGVFYMSRAALAALVEAKGNIVNLASVAGIVGQPYTAAYCAAKGGVVLLTKSMAAELWDRGVRVNCICPGGVATEFASAFDFTDLDRGLMRRSFLKMGEVMSVEEVASAVAYVASEEARSMTGTALNIDHGQSAM